MTSFATKIAVLTKDMEQLAYRYEGLLDDVLAENARLRAALEFCAQTNIGFQAVPHEVYTRAREALGQGGEATRKEGAGSNE